MGVFREGIFESVFVELVRKDGRKNDLVGVVYRPPGGDLRQFNEDMLKVLETAKNRESQMSSTSKIWKRDKLSMTIDLSCNHLWCIF